MSNTLAEIAPIPEPETVRRRIDPGLMAALVLGAALRLYDLGGYDLWADEIHSQLLAESPWRSLLTPGYMAPYMPLYFLAAKFWSQVFGSSEFALRLLPAIFGILLIPVCHELFRRMGGATVARIGALLIAVNPLLCYFSREHRMYSMYVFFLAVAALVSTESPGKAKRSDFAIAAATMLSLFTFPFAVFYSLALPILLRGEIRARLTRAFLPAWGAAGLWIVAMLVTAEPGDNALYGRLDLHMLGTLFKSAVAGNFSMTHQDLRPAAYFLVSSSAALCAIAVFSLRRQPRILGFWLLFLGIPLAIITVLQAWQGAVYNYKSFLPIALPATFLVAAGLSRLPPAPRTLFVVALAIASLWIDRALLDRSHLYNSKTSREFRYSELLTTVENSRVSADALFAPYHTIVLEGMHYGVPEDIPLFFQAEEFFLHYPAYNARSMRAILQREKALEWNESEAGKFSRLVVIGQIPPGARFPEGFALASDSPVAGASMLLRTDTSQAAR